MRTLLQQRSFSAVFIVSAVAGICLREAAADQLPGPAIAGANLATGKEFVTPANREAMYNRQFQDSLANQQFAEAEVLAKEFIEYLLRQGRARPVDTANALRDLAVVQRLMEQYEASVQNYTAAISLIESNEDMLSQNLVIPLQGLAQTYQVSGDFLLALQSYGRALHISHVNEGPHTLRQVEILNAMADANIEARNYPAAFGLLDRIRMLYERKYSRSSVELIPALSKQAELLNTLDRHGEERQVYRRIVAILAENHGETDLALVEPYVALGRTYLHQVDDVVYRSEPTTETGETFLRKALNIAETNPDAESTTVVDCLLALGDYYMILSVHDRARVQYRRAWELMSSDTTYLDHRKKTLENPVSLRRPALGRFADFDYGWDADDIEPDDLIHGHIVARFTVTERGRASNIKLIEADPDEFSKMETRVRRAVRRFIFRPRYDDGKPVRSTGQLFRHEFYYLPTDVN